MNKLILHLKEIGCEDVKNRVNKSFKKNLKELKITIYIYINILIRCTFFFVSKFFFLMKVIVSRLYIEHFILIQNLIFIFLPIPHEIL